jgi:hypothetical protein
MEPLPDLQRPNMKYPRATFIRFAGGEPFEVCGALAEELPAATTAPLRAGRRIS